MDKLELSIASVTDNLCRVEEFIGDMAGMFQLPESLRGKIALALTEAVNNSIVSGNRENPGKRVRVTATRDREKVVVTVEDEGEGFDYLHLPDPTAPENRMKSHGRGVYLMRHLSDHLSYARNGASVAMTFLLSR